MPRLSADEFTRPLDRYTQWWDDGLGWPPSRLLAGPVVAPARSCFHWFLRTRRLRLGAGIEGFRGLISDWMDDPITDAVVALLPEWVRWNGEQAGVPAALIERAVSAASAS